ncbi:MAG: hypothetical protein M5U05_18065 [Anaerolineales bacterium]|nr:hypothetical protein [Anaerolineales bacterium]
MIEGLQAILEKDIIVSTVNPRDLLEGAENVERVYQHHVSTFIPMGDMEGVAERLARKIQSEKTVKGLLTAPYGYGKTSSLAFLWRSCEDQGLLAVPPFYCASWLDILDATFGWVRFRLGNLQPGLVSEVERIYAKYTRTTLEDMARRYSEEHGISTNSAQSILDDLLEHGSLSLELSPASLLTFLDEIVGVVVRAGFHGLALFADEFQQYISKGSNLRRAIQEFRELVWGLATRTVPLGVIFSLPTYAESIVQEQGKDILQRLKDDRLYYRLSDIYSTDFPEMLWEKYALAFELGPLQNEIMAVETLHSIGQIVEREDLGEGPRTVIECFKRAIIHHEGSLRDYTPVDLIDDFLETNIRFQAQANRLKNVTRQALGSAIVDTHEKRAAIKLLAAFPRGCPVAVQKSYGLYDSVNQLSRQGHGDLLTHLAEGYTLMGLQRGEAPVRTADLIITEFWRGYEEDDLHLESARQAFARRLAARVFQRRRGAAATGWGEPEFALSTTGSYVALIEGTFNARYPRRRVRLQIAFSDDALLPLDGDTDILFNIVFEMDEHDYPGIIEQGGENSWLFRLNMRRRFSPNNMPEDIRKLQDYMNPELVTPLLMLSLMDYFDQWEQIRETVIPESEKGEISFFVDRLLNHSALLLFNQELGLSVSPGLSKTGYRMPEEAFDRICERMYPRYHTFIVHAQYENILNDYVNAMRDLNLKQRRGRATIVSTKEALARRFGLGSVATFENRARNEYQHLLDILDWSGSDAEIMLTLHPLEKEILERLQASELRRLEDQEHQALSINHIADSATQLGYRQEEILKALELLAARRFIRIDTDRKVAVLIHAGLQRDIIEEQIARVAQTLQSAPAHLWNGEDIHELSVRVEELHEAIAATREDDEEELDELSGRVNDVEADIKASMREQREQVRQHLSNWVLEVDRTLSTLQQSDILDRDIRGQVAFVMHLNELRRLLANDRDNLIRHYAAQKEELTKALNAKAEMLLGEIVQLDRLVRETEIRLERLEEQRVALLERTQHLVKWLSLLDDADSLFSALGNLPDLSDRFKRDFVSEIMAHFVRRREEKRDGLADWEPFRHRLEELDRELESRRRQGNELFVQKKEEYESLLREGRVGDWRLRSRYTHGEDDESYEDLHVEIRTKFEARLQELRDDLASTNTDWLKARYIHSISESEIVEVDRVAVDISRMAEQLEDLQQSLSVDLIRGSDDELLRFVEGVNELDRATSEMRKQLGQVLFGDHKLSNEEAATLSPLNPRTDLDLTDLFVALHKDNEEMTLNQLLITLEGLYRKNRIVIRLRRRG